jgi:hypothetical protein
MKFIAQRPETTEEKALLGAAYMLDITDIELEDDGSLNLNFIRD